MVLVTTWILAALALAPAAAAPANLDDAGRDALAALVARADVGGAVTDSVGGPGSRAMFLQVLSSDLFLHEAVGPFDLFVMKADGLESRGESRRVMTRARQGLEPLVSVMERAFGGEPGLVAGRRLPIVVASSDRRDGEQGFDQLVALLDWAEDDYSGWKPSGNPVWTDEQRAKLTVRTWEVQLFNLAHADAVAQGDAFLDHGLGYYTLAHVTARVLRQGAWGMVPPWLAQGLIDELDIAAYGEAWVGGDWFERQTPGWFRPGWSGFVPQGMSPPAPVRGPPADLAVTVKDSGDSWQHRSNSGARHWNDLVVDRGSEAPASFAFMAEHESFLPRDRAYARCVLHLLTDVALEEGQPPLTERLDRTPSTPPSGMPDADPITVVFDRALGGLPEVAELEAMPLGDVLELVGHPEIREQIEALGADEMLALSDHREQADWLYRQPADEMEWDTRNALWTLILEAEYYQQLHAWRALGAALDRAAAAAFAASAEYPKRGPTRQRVGQAFREALSE